MDFFDVLFSANPKLETGMGAGQIYSLVKVSDRRGGYYWHGHATAEQYAAIKKMKGTSEPKTLASLASTVMAEVAKPDASKTLEQMPHHVYGSIFVDDDDGMIYDAGGKNRNKTTDSEAVKK
jgi:hypothetical protein